MKKNLWWSRLHFLVRFLGLTGLLAAAFGGILLLADRPELAWMLIQIGGGTALAALVVEVGVGLGFVAGRRSAFGTNVVMQVALATLLLVVVNVISFFYSARFDCTRPQPDPNPGSESTTSVGKFTLPDTLRQQLANLRGTTRIVVLQQHKTFGQLSDKPDSFDYAAERKVVEKVLDVVDMFREAGPQFEVFVLDVENEHYSDELDRATVGAPELKKAIEAAPENSIFFWVEGGKGHVQRLSFNEFYTLDKTASRKANDGQGNLVLLNHGLEAFARKVLNVEERKPRIAIAVNHEWLTTEGPDLYGLSGLRKALERQGFEVRDVVLQRLVPSEFQPGRFRVEPSAYTYDESRFNSLETRIKGLDEILSRIRAILDENAKDGKGIAEGDDKALAQVLARQDPRSRLGRSVLEQLIQVYARELGGMRATLKNTVRGDALVYIQEQTDSLNEQLKQFQQARDKRVAERDALNAESFAEQRRMTDLKAKLTNVLDDCDLVLVPRMTIMSLVPELSVPPEIHNWDSRQVEALRDWIKKGKPIFACFGPPAVSGDEDQPAPAPTPDGLESLLANLGVVFTRDTVLHNIEAEGLSAAPGRSRAEVSDIPDKVPPVEFQKRGQTKSHPISKSMQLASSSVGRPLDLEIRYPRPLEYETPKGQTRGGGQAPDAVKANVKGSGELKPGAVSESKGTTAPEGTATEKGVGWDGDDSKKIFDAGVFVTACAAGGGLGSLAPLFDLPPNLRATAKGGGAAQTDVPAEFLLTSLESWREESPFPSAGRMMLPTPGKQGPFPIGVAVETEVPSGWYGDQYPLPERRTVRVAAIGHGGWFIGGDLNPAKQKLVQDTCNWLLRRDEVFNPGQEWSYPRVQMETSSRNLWAMSMTLGPLAVFVYLGFTMMLIRRLR